LIFTSFWLEYNYIQLDDEVRSMELVKLSSKGQMVIPKAVREQLGIQLNKFVLLEVEKDRAVIRAAPDVRKSLKGLLKGKSSMVEALIAEHREEVQRG
jgi:AbrB family looped-hinge helix DNA binding protein